MIYPPKGDAFAARNNYAMKIDFELQPPMFKISDTHSAATWLLHPDAPKVEIDYTEKRNLRKSPGQPPGFVIYHTNYSMVAAPDRSRVAEVENQG